MYIYGSVCQDEPMTTTHTVEGSKPGVTYKVTVPESGAPYCSCPAWKFQKVAPSERTCKHIVRVLATEAEAYLSRLAAS
jgi:hypothetical protein